MTIIQNPDKEYAMQVRERLRANGNYCPCRLEKTDDTKCMCKEFRDMMERGEKGFCHCQLYLIK